ncbi:MAG: hypothetical protein II304_07770 [Bacteroidales bacterium]|nr:hypothetical protein [Bacteroidales bacterium]
MIDIPKEEMLWLQYKNINGTLTYLITSNIFRTEYYLYKVTNNKPKKTKYKAENPLDLNKYIKE